MNTDVEILDKMPASWIQQSIKRIIYHNQAGFTQRMQCKAVLLWANLFREHINGSNKGNCMIILSRIRKITYEDSTWIPKGDILWNTRNAWYQWTMMGFFLVEEHFTSDPPPYVWEITHFLNFGGRQSSSSPYRNGENSCPLLCVPAPPLQQQWGTWPKLKWQRKDDKQKRMFFKFQLYWVQKFFHDGSINSSNISLQGQPQEKHK